MVNIEISGDRLSEDCTWRDPEVKAASVMIADVMGSAAIMGPCTVKLS